MAWVDLMFQAPRMPYRIVLGVVLQAFQQLTGANYFFYYVRVFLSSCRTGLTVLTPCNRAPVIFKGAGISNVFVTQMILGGVNFGTTFGGL